VDSLGLCAFGPARGCFSVSSINKIVEKIGQVKAELPAYGSRMLHFTVVSG